MKTALLALLATLFALPAAAQQVSHASRPPGGGLYSVQYQTNGLLFGGVTLGGNQILVGQVSGPPIASTVSAALDAAFGSTRGALLERGASGWTLLPPGTSGFCLTSTGSGSDPIYQACTGGGGTLTIVALSMPGIFSLSGSPVTGGGGTITASLVNETANQVWAGPASGSAAAPAFRALVGADLPASGVTAGTYGNASHAAQVTVNAAGVVTGASSIAITGVDAATINGATPAPSAVLDATNLSNDTTGQLFGIAALPNLPANSLPMNATGSTGAETAIAIPTCAVLAYTAGTPGAFSCGPGGSGTVTSVGLLMPGIFSVSGSPVTSSGNLSASLNSQSANTIFAGPSSGSGTTPVFRAMVAADLPSGVALTGSANTFTATQTFATIGGYLANVNGQTTTAYTLTSTDCGTFLKLSNASTITVTLPNNLSIGCEVAIEQSSTGQVVLSPASGASLQSAHSYTKTLGRFSIIGIAIDANAGGSSAEYIFSGDGST